MEVPRGSLRSIIIACPHYAEVSIFSLCDQPFLLKHLNRHRLLACLINRSIDPAVRPLFSPLHSPCGRTSANAEPTSPRATDWASWAQHPAAKEAAWKV
eukprot:1158190-Pelagomonas_calceolata.AAC.8